MKIGKIKITEECFRNGISSAIKLVFKEFIPVHIDRNDLYGIIIYTGYCNQFEEINEGEFIPIYEVKYFPVDGEIKFEKI